MLDLKMLLTLSLVVAAAAAQAQDYPGKPIRLIVPFATGGAGGNIGTELVAQAAPTATPCSSCWTTHVAAELLKQRTGLDMQHIAYKSGGLAVLC